MGGLNVSYIDEPLTSFTPATIALARLVFDEVNRRYRNLRDDEIVRALGFEGNRLESTEYARLSVREK